MLRWHAPVEVDDRQKVPPVEVCHAEVPEAPAIAVFKRFSTAPEKLDAQTVDNQH
jgi:hypothetical protein